MTAYCFTSYIYLCHYQTLILVTNLRKSIAKSTQNFEYCVCVCVCMWVVDQCAYRTASFVCKVLIFVNYVSCGELANFNSTVTFALSFQLTTHVTVCACDFFILCLCSYFKRGRLLLCCLTQKAKGLQWLCT